MKTILVCAILIIAKTCEAEGAGITDGNSLAQGMKMFKRVEEGASLTEREYAIGVSAMSYLRGFLGSSDLWTKIDKACPFKLPEGSIPTGQFFQVVDKYLTAHPENLHKPADLLVLEALMEGFPNRELKRQSQDH